MALKGRDIISILDVSRSELEELFLLTDNIRSKMSENRLGKPLEGYVIALAFFEPSTRTRLSFESAALRLGAKVIGFTSEEATSIAKGESFADTIRMLDNYSDVIIVRHRYEGAAKYAAEVAEHPVINAGDGKQHHPTQAMLDLYTVRELFGKIDGLTYMIIGDLRYARAAASFALALSHFKPRMVYLVSPPLLRMREEIKDELTSRGLAFEELSDPYKVIDEVDVMYVTRIQKERFPDPMDYEKVKGSYKVDLNLLKRASDKLKILHPLPRVDEIDPRIDETPHAAYFLQASLGVPLRMALLLSILGERI